MADAVLRTPRKSLRNAYICLLGGVLLAMGKKNVSWGKTGLQNDILPFYGILG